MTESRYAEAGVDLAGAEAAKRRIAEAVRTTRTELSAGRVGGFGGMVRIPEGYRRPLLVMSTDGVGTKVLVAREAGRFDTVGADLVNHGVNDILVHGARPLAFLDYIAGAGLSIDQLAAIVQGVAGACRAHGMDLTGGETAEMPGLYRAGDFDLAGTIVGVVEESDALHGDAIAPGDALLGLASSGLHTNGYSLARRILFEQLRFRLETPLPETGTTVAEALLAVHRSYWAALRPVLGSLHGLAHITGGGIPGNLTRVLPDRCEAVVEATSWIWPPLFSVLQQGGKVPVEEMREVFNLGVGMMAVMRPDRLASVQSAASAAGIESWRLGEIRRGERGVRFV